MPALASYGSIKVRTSIRSIRADVELNKKEFFIHFRGLQKNSIVAIVV
jgi:hypothetical protein